MIHAIKLYISDEERAWVDHILTKAHDFVQSKIPNNEKLILFWANENGVSKDTSGGPAIAGTVEGLDWNTIQEAVPELIEIYQRYPIEKNYLLVTTQDVTPHSHPDFGWSLTFINSKCPGKLKFFALENEDMIDDRGKVGGMAHLLNWTCIEELDTEPKDQYSLDTYTWHGWSTDDANPIVTVLTLKNACSYEEAYEVVSSLNSKLV
jgi:hypothetical protein